MKARFFKKISLGLVLSTFPFVGAYNQQTSDVAPSLVTAAQAEPSFASDTSTATLAGGPVAPETTPPPAESAPIPTPAPNSGKTLPPNIKPSSPVGEVVKLAQAGVDEAVMLSYVNNAASMFNLASDEIIYLNDIGVPNGVVTAMIQRDQALKQVGANAAQAQNAAAQPNAQVAEAAAPTYANPPQPEAQPATADAAPPEPPANVTYNYFNDSLSPYGSWIDIEGYGRCWQPTVVVINRGWQPYCDRGRWLYTDAGWYWNSDYSWGWATFHYGRWFNHARWGWCWYPDSVWGPSWVSWRYSNDYCGWAPLPPAAYYRPGFGFSYYNSSVGVSFGFGLNAGCYTFVPWGHFCDSRPWHYRAPATRVTQIYNNTTIINNIVTGNHNTIINHGIPIDQVRRHTRTEIRQVAIRETRNAGFGARGERLERDGRTLVVHRPTVSQIATGSAMSPSFTRDSQAGHRPAAGAGAAAQTETSRGQGRGQVEDMRNRTITQPVPAVGGNTRATSPTARPAPGGSGSTPRSRDERPNNPTRDRSRDNNHSSTTPPLIVRGEERASTTPPTQKAPRGSLVVIGRRDFNPGQNRSTDNERRSTPARSTLNWSATQPAPTDQSYAAVPQGQTPRTSSPTSPGSFSYNHPTVETPRYERHDSSRQTAPSVRPQYSAPTYSAPRSRPAPSYSAPSYSAPRSTPTPFYSTPRSSPAPSYTPAPSRAPAAAPAQDRSQSGRDGSSRRNWN